MGTDIHLMTARMKLRKEGPEALLQYIDSLKQKDRVKAEKIYRQVYPGAKNGQDTEMGQNPTPDINKSLVDKLSKGGAGSGRRGHTTNKPMPEKNPKDMTNKLADHLKELRGGATMEGHQTQSGKPILLDMEHATAQGYTPEDHKDAMDLHYRIAQKWGESIEKYKQAGKVIPDEARHIHKFHQKKFKEHFNTGQRIMERQRKTQQAEEEKQRKVIKAITSMGHQESPDLNTSDFAIMTDDRFSKEWEQTIKAAMDGFEYGDSPREVELSKGDLTLVKVDDGLYTGFFTKKEEGLEDNSKIRIERITIPDLVQLLIAKEFIVQPEATQEEPLSSVAEKLESPVDKLQDSLDKKIEILKLVNKLMGIKE